MGSLAFPLILYSCLHLLSTNQSHMNNYSSKAESLSLSCQFSPGTVIVTGHTNAQKLDRIVGWWCFRHLIVAAGYILLDSATFLALLKSRLADGPLQVRLAIFVQAASSNSQSQWFSQPNLHKDSNQSLMESISCVEILFLMFCVSSVAPNVHRKGLIMLLLINSRDQCKCVHQIVIAWVCSS